MFFVQVYGVRCTFTSRRYSTKFTTCTVKLTTVHVWPHVCTCMCTTSTCNYFILFYKMEDSIYVKKSAIDRGLFMMTYFHTFFCEAKKCEAKNRGSEKEIN